MSQLTASKQQPCVTLQGGSLQYHQGSLRNLATAVKQEKKLCAVMLDTTGRELLIRRHYTLDEQVGYDPLGHAEEAPFNLAHTCIPWHIMPVCCSNRLTAVSSIWWPAWRHTARVLSCR